MLIRREMDSQLIPVRLDFLHNGALDVREDQHIDENAHGQENDRPSKSDVQRLVHNNNLLLLLLLRWKRRRRMVLVLVHP